MSRRYTADFIETVRTSDSDSAGVALAKACIDANLPAAYVAKILNVSRMTLHAWFRGKPIRFRNMLLIESLTARIQNDLTAGVLPAQTKKEALTYLDALGKTVE